MFPVTFVYVLQTLIKNLLTSLTYSVYCLNYNIWKSHSPHHWYLSSMWKAARATWTKVQPVTWIKVQPVHHNANESHTTMQMRATRQCEWEPHDNANESHTTMEMWATRQCKWEPHDNAKWEPHVQCKMRATCTSPLDPNGPYVNLFKLMGTYGNIVWSNSVARVRGNLWELCAE